MLEINEPADITIAFVHDIAVLSIDNAVKVNLNMYMLQQLVSQSTRALEITEEYK